MHKRYLPVTIVTALLFAVGLAGYLMPAPAQKMPVRILFDNNGGRVFFSHLRHHKDYEIPCAQCHHTEDGAEEPLPCGSCHPKSFDQNFVREHVNSFPDTSKCVTCHHAEFGELAFNHEGHKEFADCTDCHHGPDIEEEPGHCSDCHDLAGDDEMPSVRDAAHQRCAECHDDLFAAGVKGCKPCHRMKDMTNYEGSYTPCNQCHQSPEPDRELVLTRTNAFHDQCMNCHKEHQQGPFGENDCNLCHVR